MWEELLKEIVIIKWAVVCIAVILSGITTHLLLKEIPAWRNRRELGRRRKELEGSTRPRTERGPSQWD